MVDTQWWAERAVAAAPGEPDPVVLGRYRRWVGPLIRAMHRPTLDGVDNLPDGPFVLVANHSGGVAISEIMSLVLLYSERLDGVRLAGMAHPVSFHVWPLTTFMRWMGAIPSSYAAAADALARGAGVLIFPGGDYEVSRPLWHADRVDFNRRKGFLRIARDAGVPIVPLGIAGSHLSAPVLGRSTFILPWGLVLPKLFGLKRYPIMLLGVVGVALALIFGPALIGWPLSIALAWLWMASPFPLLPYVPVTIRMRIGPPIAPQALFHEGDEDLDAAYDRVRDAVQQLVLGRGPA